MTRRFPIVMAIAMIATLVSACKSPSAPSTPVVPQPLPQNQWVAVEVEHEITVAMKGKAVNPDKLSVGSTLSAAFDFINSLDPRKNAYGAFPSVCEGKGTPQAADKPNVWKCTMLFPPLPAELFAQSFAFNGEVMGEVLRANGVTLVKKNCFSYPGKQCVEFDPRTLPPLPAGAQLASVLTFVERR